MCQTLNGDDALLHKRCKIMYSSINSPGVACKQCRETIAQNIPENIPLTVEK